MDQIKLFLSDAQAHPGFQALIKKAKESIPPVPAYDPKEDNTEQWKYDSALREGFLSCLAHFGVKEDD